MPESRKYKTTPTKVQVSPNPKGIYFREPDGTITRLTPHYRGDFTLEQKRPGNKPVIFSVYSDMGAMPFALFLKFLYLNKAKIPTIPHSKRGFSRDVERRFEDAGMMASMSPFPIPFPAELKTRGGAEIITAHWVKEGKEPRIEFRREDGTKISVSIPLAQKLVKTMPETVGGRTSPFRMAYAILRQAIRRNEFEERKKSKPELVPRQREFGFHRQARKKAWKAKLAIPRKRRVSGY